MTNTINLSSFKFPNYTRYLIAVALVFLFAPSAFVIIDAGTVGVVKRLGAVKMIPLQEGLHFKVPFVETVVPVNIRLNGANSEALSSSKDLQTVRTVVSVQYSINGDMAPMTFQKIGLNPKIQATVIGPSIGESVKAVTAKYTAEELITKRETVKEQIQMAIQTFIDKTLNEKAIANGISIANVAITDFQFSEEFNRAIELKVKAEQEALQAKNEKIRRVTQAEAAAAERQLGADAEAYSVTVQSKARADAIQREARALRGNPNLVELRRVEKWNGELPRFTGGATPLMDVSKILK
ncbi:MAG: prohibitin family protein [Candidatus Marinamargulisbacteria bacterium]|jgi:regulator of protease activity HflC (stomatin/prohibitin superfamily)|nr:HflC protein [bacterium]MDG2265334.1 prohibitin family protein [Candidatus Marinamargulisbacteria bacterium]|tara:strand:- start:2297 stop:3184 length:888 start_codon:yes stop_codon:yes gene_type:complete